ncbi:MAG TPA: Ig-like domain-containing protein, partial [Gemmatimonadales bacterium]|nr:Ig-like domain-containing protein [Gemmatimonadales bacterium]
MNGWRLAGSAVVLAAAAAALPTAGAAQRQPAVADIQVQPGDAQVAVHRTTQFFATAYDRGNNALPTVSSFTWRSSNPRVATIDENGVATGVSPGTTSITARHGTGHALKVSEPATLTVVGEASAPQPQSAGSGGARGAARTGPGCAALARQQPGTGVPDGLVINPQHLILIKGESSQLQYRTVRGATGDPAEPACILFQADAGRVAAIDSFGVVTSMGDTGRAMVTAAVSGARFAPRQVQVEVRGDSVQFAERSVSLVPGTVDTLALVVPAQDSRRLDPERTSFQFASSDPARVTVSPVAPIVTAVAVGTARITASSPLFADITATVSVHKPFRRLIASPLDTLVTVAIQGAAALGVRFFAADSTVVDGVPVRWIRPDTTIARFDSASGTLRGVHAGDTRISVVATQGRSDSAMWRWHVRVVAGGLAIAMPRFALPVGAQLPLAVQLLDDHRRPLGPAPGLSWHSSDDSTARLSADGRVTGLAMGHAQLVARAPWDSTVAADAFVVGDVLVPAERGGRWDLLMVRSGDSPALRTLGQDSTLKSQPTWAPDWTRVAYVAPGPRPELPQVYVAAADGSDPRLVTQDSVPARSPAFVGPSGDQIVFEAGRAGRTQLFVVDRDGGQRRQLTSGAAPSMQPSVSPDGKRVLYVSLREHLYNV